MKSGQRLWTRDELILAINLYCKLPFGKMHSRNPDIKELATLLGRTPSSVARKLGNFASFDPDLKARGIRGLYNASKLDGEIWNEFYLDWDNRFIESERILSQKQGKKRMYEYSVGDLAKVGEDQEQLVKVRLNQSVFRDMVLSNFESRCCITGINRPELLIAGHIIPWSIDTKNRLNPKNGLALNALHDKAFENGLITITEDYKVKVSSALLEKAEIKAIRQNFIQYDNKNILLPKKFMPDREFLKYHNQQKFKG